MGLYDLDLEGGGSSRTAHTAFLHNRRLKPSKHVLVIVKTAHIRHQHVRILLRDTHNARERLGKRIPALGRKAEPRPTKVWKSLISFLHANSAFIISCISDLRERDCVCALVFTPVPLVWSFSCGYVCTY